LYLKILECFFDFSKITNDRHNFLFKLTCRGSGSQVNYFLFPGFASCQSADYLTGKTGLKKTIVEVL